MRKTSPFSVISGMFIMRGGDKEKGGMPENTAVETHYS